MVQRFKETCHPVFTSANTPSRGILRTLKGKRNHTLQCGCFKHRILGPNHSFCESAQYLRTVSSRCEQFGLTEDEKGQERTLDKGGSVNKGMLKSVNSQEVNSLVSSPRLALETVCGKTFRTSNHCPRLFNSRRFANSHRSGTEYRLV